MSYDDKNWIRNQYWNLGKSACQIDRENNLYNGAISRRMRKFNIPKREKPLSGKRNGMWKGGKRKDKSGYIMIYKPEHPYGSSGYIREHRLVIEEYLGRYLKPTEIVHHINGVKNDNRLENLFLCKNNEHKLLESSLWKILPELINKKIIKFNKEMKKYEVLI